MYQKDIPVREAIQVKDLESEVAGEPQESEYDLLKPLTVSFNGNLAKSLAQGMECFSSANCQISIPSYFFV